jgi:hypothetical protein
MPNKIGTCPTEVCSLLFQSYLFPCTIAVMIIFYSSSNCTPEAKTVHFFVHFSSLKFALVPSSVLLFWKQLVYEFLLCCIGDLLASVCVLILT